MTSGLVWVAFALLAVAALLPLGLHLRRPAAARGRREADLALYRAQMAELDREAEAGRLEPEALRAARVELQRRLLTAPAEAAAPVSGRSRIVLLAMLVAAPLAALGLYWGQGFPDMPSAPHAIRAEMAAREDALLATLRGRIATLPPGSAQAKEGWILVGNAERSRGRSDAAIDAFRQALRAGFDPELVSQIAQVLIEADRAEDAVAVLREALPQAPTHVGLRFLTGLAALRVGRPAEARAAWQALVAEAPPGVPWRAMVERRLQDLP